MIALFIALVGTALGADGTDLLAHQGRLIDALGQGIEGSQTITFSIYPDPDSNTSAWVWTETRTVQLADGYYSLNLGETSPFPDTLFDDPTLYLGIATGTQELQPRQQLTAIAYGGAAGFRGEISDAYPDDPQLAMGFEPGNYNQYQWLEFPFTFDAPPIVLSTIDESMNESGPVWLRQIEKRRDRVGYYTDASLEGFHWLAIEPGVHTMDGKKVIAGTVTSGVNGGTVTFPEAFSAPPIIMVSTVTLDNSGAVSTRVINSPTTSSFQYYTDTDGDGMDWVAFEPGEYTVGRYHFYVGSNSPASINSTFSWPDIFTNQPSGVLTIHDTNNSGASYIRWHQVDPNQGRIYVNSTSEIMNYVMFEDLGD